MYTLLYEKNVGCNKVRLSGSIRLLLFGLVLINFFNLFIQTKKPIATSRIFLKSGGKNLNVLRRRRKDFFIIFFNNTRQHICCDFS